MFSTRYTAKKPGDISVINHFLKELGSTQQLEERQNV